MARLIRFNRAGDRWPCGIEAREKLRRTFGDRNWVCVITGNDRARSRLVGRCRVDGVDVNSWLVGEGWALDYVRYSRGAYTAMGREARERCTGLWAGTFIRPSEWRGQAASPQLEGCRTGGPLDARKLLQSMTTPPDQQCVIDRPRMSGPGPMLV
jgi:endonuclease YncB( thermonuclease family)